MNEQTRIYAKSHATRKGQTTIPKPVRDALGIGDGTELTWRVDGGTLTITAKTLDISDFAGFLGEPPSGAHLTAEEMNDAIGEAIVERFRRKTVP